MAEIRLPPAFFKKLPKCLVLFDNTVDEVVVGPYRQHFKARCAINGHYDGRILTFARILLKVRFRLIQVNYFHDFNTDNGPACTARPPESSGTRPAWA